jgi:hypothetical protein
LSAAYDKWWDQMRIAHEFFTANAVPFQDMTNRSELVSTGWALEGKGMLVAYFPNGPVGGNRGSATGAAYAPRFPALVQGFGAAINPFEAPKGKTASGREGRDRLRPLSRKPPQIRLDRCRTRRMGRTTFQSRWPIPCRSATSIFH